MTPSPRSRSFSKLFKLKEEIDKLIKAGATVPFIAVTESCQMAKMAELLSIYIDQLLLLKSHILMMITVRVLSVFVKMLRL